MPAEKNRTLRVVVPIIVILAAIGIAVAFFINATGGGSTGANKTPSAPATPDASDGAPEMVGQDAGEADEPRPEAAETPSDIADDAPGQPEASGDEQPPVTTPIAGLRARRFAPPDEPLVLGSIDEASGFNLEAVLTPVGAGVERIRSSYYYKTIAHKEHYLIQQQQVSQDGQTVAIPLSVTGILVNGQWVPLFNDGDRRLWRVKSSGPTRASFEAIIEDESGAEVLRLERLYTLDQGTFDLRVSQRVENLSGMPVEFSFVQIGPVELPEDLGGYRIALDRVRFGALLDARRDPSRTIVHADDRLLSGADALKMSTKPGAPPVWPNPKTYEGFGDLVWVAQTSRYFSAMVHATPQDNQDKALWSAATVYPRSLAFFQQTANGPATYADGLYLEMHSHPFTAPPAQSVTLDMGFYAGPTSETYLSAKADPMYGRAGMDQIIIYQLSFGMCAVCTFQWLADLLHAFLSFLHKYVVFDWALAIMVLVVIVRTILHPITKKSQIAMMRFSKQMQALAPKQKAIQEKYKNDRVKMQQEMTRLMREEGVNYAGMLGCVPMFLQTPIWIALYAMLYTAFDLRHEPAFFGVVQSIFPNWSFLGDLSVGDHLVQFPGGGFDIPLISGLMGTITGINILPILLGVVFYIQQKYMSPPPSAQLTPEQQSQQKMIKIMMIVMFPLFMYNAPSALAIYFITNSTLGILESRYIRSHVDQDALVPDKPRHGALGRKKVANRAARSPFKHDPEPRKRFKDRQ